MGHALASAYFVTIVAGFVVVTLSLLLHARFASPAYLYWALTMLGGTLLIMAKASTHYLSLTGSGTRLYLLLSFFIFGLSGEPLLGYCVPRVAHGVTGRRIPAVQGALYLLVVAGLGGSCRDRRADRRSGCGGHPHNHQDRLDRVRVRCPDFRHSHHDRQKPASGHSRISDDWFDRLAHHACNRTRLSSSSPMALSCVGFLPRCCSGCPPILRSASCSSSACFGPQDRIDGPGWIFSRRHSTSPTASVKSSDSSSRATRRPASATSCSFPAGPW